MALHSDLPTRSQIVRLLQSRHPASVSIYLATDPASTGDAERIELQNLATAARRQLEHAGLDGAGVAAIDEALAELGEDDAFWRYQARSLSIFATPDSLRTYRLPNRLVSLVEVSDRFHVKPLLRALTFPQVCFVLALAQGSVRLVEVTPDVAPAEVHVPELPSDVASAAGKSSIKDRSPSGRSQGAEGQKVRMRQYARQIDEALRPLLNGADVPLILAAAEPMDAIFRSVNTYPHLAAAAIPGSPEATSDADLATAARRILDDLYATELREIHELYGLRDAEQRATSDIANVARAATFGAVDTVLVDIDDVVPGSIDPDDGRVTFVDENDATTYGVIDEIARRVWLTGGRVLAVRRADIPGRGSVAAILRYPL